MRYKDFYDWWNKTREEHAGKDIKTMALEAWDAAVDGATEPLKSAPAVVSPKALERFAENPLRSELCKVIEAHTTANSRTMEIEFDYQHGVDALIRFLTAKSG